MKKLLLWICIAFSIANLSYGQINYTFTQAATGAITPITGYTQLAGASVDEGVWTNIPIGFTFTYNCVNYTAVSISNDGYIAMGTSLTNSFTPLSTGTDNNVIAVLANDLIGRGAGSLRYVTKGTAGNHTFTVEWLKYRLNGGGGSYDFQLILYENGSIIKIYYKCNTKDNGVSYQVGLRGSSSADFLNRTKMGAATWITSSAGTLNTDVMNCGNGTTLGPEGVFTWTPVFCSGTPTGGTAIANPSTVCNGQTSILTVSGGSTACGITYKWQSAPPPGTVWTDIVGATSATYSATPATSTYYRRVTTCGANSANSSSVLVTVNPFTPTPSPPISDGFEGCPEWTIVNGTQANKWYLGTAVNNGGLMSMYITNDGGITNAYTNTTASTVHFYRDVTFPAGQTCITLSFDWRGNGESCCDFIKLYAVPTTTTPVAGTELGSTELIGGAYNVQNTWQTATIVCPSSWAGTTKRLVFSWHNDGSVGTSPSGAIDNINITAVAPPVPNCANYSSPANGTTGIVCGANALLYWAPNGPACGPPTSYDIYFGTAATPPFIVNQTGTMYNPGTLLPSTTYYWQIVPRNSSGPATGCSIYHFTTGATYSPSQTSPPIIDGFENCNEWTMVNGTQVNKWILGSATSHTGSNSMYINNTGTNNDYAVSTSSVVHFYKDINFPAGKKEYYLNFYWKGMGESSYDYLKVYLVPTSITPVAGTELSSTYALTPGYYNLSSTWSYFSKSLPIACGGGETWRLVFSWKNDGSAGTQPPIAIDDIEVSSANRLGTTCANPINVTLPYIKTGETTNCMGDDYSNASPASCGSNYESSSDKVYKVMVGAAGCLNVTLSNCSSTSIGFQVYQGCPDVAGSTCIYNSTTGANSGSLSADVTIPTPGNYYFIVDNWTTPSYVNYDISISQPGITVANDLVTGAIPLTLGVTANGDNSCTSAAGEASAPFCWTTGAMNTVWYRVTIPASRDLAIQTIGGSLLNTQIEVFTGNIGSLTSVGCNDNAPSCGTQYYHSYILLEGLTGTYAYIRVDGENDLVGTFSIIAIDGNNGSPTWPPIIGQDCGAVATSTNPLCNPTTTVENPGFFAYGNICDFTGSGICLVSGERSSIWYTINIIANGILEFDIVPNDYGNPNPITGQINPGYISVGDETDYDYALWRWEPTCDGVTGDSTFCCAEISTGANAPTRCNYNSLGVTGLYGPTGNAPAIYPGFDAAYEPRLNVVAGEKYVLVLSNFANDYVSGYTLQFSPTSPVGFVTPGATLVWSSNTSNAWTQPGNWGGCSAPSCQLSAQINPGGAQPVILTDASIKDLTINPGATLTINAGATLTVCGNFTNNGNLVMAPTSTLLFNNGSVVQTINGSLTGTNKIAGLVIDKTGGSVTINANIDIGNFTTANATSIFNANNYIVKVGGNFYTADALTRINFDNIEFNGTVPQTYSNGANNVAWSNVIINNTGGGISLIGGTASNLYIGNGGTLTLTNGIIYTSGPPWLFMNAGSAVSGGSSISFVDGPMRKTGTTAFVFPLGDAFNRYMPLGISAPTAATTFTARYFYNSYSNTSSMAVSPLPVLYNVSANEYWLLDRTVGTGNTSVTLYWNDAASSGIDNCLPLQTGDLTVARWNGSGWENASSTIVGGITGSCVGASSGSVTSDLVTSFSPFTFGSKAPIVNPLPMQLMSFKGKNNGDENILEWVTATETNNDYFTLQRSTDGFSFKDISTIDAAGNSNQITNYQYTDKNINYGTNYYRLKQTDYDGGFRFAPNLIALNRFDSPSFKLYPNPAKNEVTITTSNYINEKLTIVFKDLIGNTILKKTTVNLEKNSNSATINISDLSSGTYLVSIMDNNDNPLSFQKLVILK